MPGQLLVMQLVSGRGGLQTLRRCRGSGGRVKRFECLFKGLDDGLRVGMQGGSGPPRVGQGHVHGLACEHPVADFDSTKRGQQQGYGDQQKLDHSGATLWCDMPVVKAGQRERR